MPSARDIPASSYFLYTATTSPWDILRAFSNGLGCLDRHINENAVSGGGKRGVFLMVSPPFFFLIINKIFRKKQSSSVSLAKEPETDQD